MSYSESTHGKTVSDELRRRYGQGATSPNPGESGFWEHRQTQKSLGGVAFLLNPLRHKHLQCVWVTAAKPDKWSGHF
jgi:hypothetical protein